MPYITTTGSGNHHENNKPVAKVRDLEADERFVLTEYETHAGKCGRCVDALDSFREGRALCNRGLEYALDVASYIYTKSGKAYSVVDKDHGEDVLVRIPRDFKSCRRLLLAIEEGLRLRREQAAPIVSYDATYPVSARRPATADSTATGAGSDDNNGEPVTEIIERAPRTRRRVIIYRRASPGRTSSSRGSLYEADRVDRHERRQHVRVSR